MTYILSRNLHQGTNCYITGGFNLSFLYAQKNSIDLIVNSLTLFSICTPTLDSLSDRTKDALNSSPPPSQASYSQFYDTATFFVCSLDHAVEPQCARNAKSKDPLGLYNVMAGASSSFAMTLPLICILQHRQSKFHCPRLLCV